VTKRLGLFAATLAVLAVAVPTAVGAGRAKHLAAPPTSQAQAAYAAMTPAERVGQLFMAGISSTNPAPTAIAALRAHHVGSVILDGNSALGVAATSTIVTGVTAGLTVGSVQPFIATDQEGGEVQRLTGPGFSAIPSALAQGRLAPAVLQRRATGWGRQLESAGVTLNLAPVADTVPAAHAHANQPIGRYDREYGHTPGVVAPHVAAVVRGETVGGVDVTIKHFPGLGRADGNTDVAVGVTDPTARHSAYLLPFHAGVTAGAPFVMCSFAIYPHIDPGHVGCLSKTIVTDMLRGDLGFTGVVISDSFHGKAVRAIGPRRAALGYFRAGGTMLLDTTRQTVYLMEQAVLAETAADPAFAKTIKADVLDVLSAKADAGLL
jgi:beta-N-acetylhexosaminidase